jgi:hypothetical protein
VISQLANRVLFVAAAGHQQEGVGTDLSGFCSVYPACLDKPNLLGVVALEGDREAPLVPSWANFGSRLGIGALGADVLSTGQESGFVLLDGSSMASPQVSAVASLLFAKLGSVTPSQVKNRLLACAVPTQELQGRVLSGRLQARCALENPETDRLVLADPPETLFGTLVGGRLAGGAIDQLELFNEEMETTSSRAWQRIYGLRRDPAGLGRLVLWVHQRPNEAHQSQLERHAGLVVAPEQAEIELLFRPLTGPERLVPLSRLVEYVAAIR